MKTTKRGKAFAPVMDIFPQIVVGYHDQERVAEEMRLLKSFGFERVYFVLTNPGYPMFSNPYQSIQPQDIEGLENYALKSIVALGDPNFAYVHECHRHGMEAFAIIKPYEGGGGSTVPHGARMLYKPLREETIGGERIGFDNFLKAHPHLRVKRKPIPNYEKLIAQNVEAITLLFCVEPIKVCTDSCDKFHGAISAGASEAPAKYRLFLSEDNGKYVEYDGPLEVSERVENRMIRDANGSDLFPGPSRCRAVSLSALHIPESVRYFAVVIECGEKLYTIPQSMIYLHGPEAEIPCTVSPYIRRAGNTKESIKEPGERLWGMEQMPLKCETPDTAIRELCQWGFEHEWHGSGWWGPGWQNGCVYGIAKGKLEWMKGTPCEAYPEVREYWLDCVRKHIEMGFDGIDIRLQNHSGMVSDYANYGYNEPLVEAYRDKHGVDILSEKADPLKLMAVRGDFFAKFIQEAAQALHGAGRKLQIHLRNCHESPRASADFNELGFWAMPKVWHENWRQLIDIADEITLKDYHFNQYDSSLARKIKQYAKSCGKRVWVHCYVSQGGDLNEEFIGCVEKDEDVSGVLFYEVAHSSANEVNFGLIEQYGPVGLNEPAAKALRQIMERFGYGTSA